MGSGASESPSETKKWLLNWAAGRLRVTLGIAESGDSVLPGRDEERLGGEGAGPDVSLGFPRRGREVGRRWEST